MVAVFITALAVGISAEAVSLFLSLIQTVIAIFSMINYEEGFSMVNRMLVASGTHGVVRILVGGYLLLQVPSRFNSCPLRHIEGYLSGWPSFFAEEASGNNISIMIK